MKSFFRPGKAPCPIYCRTRDLPQEHHARGRAFIEQLWQECAPFLDANAPHHAMQGLPSVFWELYLTHALRHAGISIAQQQRTKKRQRGPDLLAEHPDVWLEAVTPTPGTGQDALQPPRLGEVYDTPVDAFVIRLRSAIEAKADIIKGYINDGLIQEGQATIIAISGMLLYTQHNEQPIPRIVRAALATGDLVLEFDPQHQRSSEYSVEHCDEISKAKGATVRTDIFLDPTYKHVSALLYSTADWVNLPKQPGTEFIIVHNHQATTPLPHGWLSVGDEYWREDDTIRRERHPTPNGAKTSEGE
jgi:hypothetical protein